MTAAPPDPRALVGLPRTDMGRGFISKGDRRQMWRDHLRWRDGDACWYCGDHVGTDEETIEHLLPRFEEPEHRWAEWNLALAHPACNNVAGTLPLLLKLWLRRYLRDHGGRPALTHRTLAVHLRGGNRRERLLAQRGRRLERKAAQPPRPMRSTTLADLAPALLALAARLRQDTP